MGEAEFERVLDAVNAAIAWAIFTTPRKESQGLLLPASIFTAAFAFVLAVKSLLMNLLTR